MSVDHELKVWSPYFDALANGSKPFDVRRNDRAFQRGHTLALVEHHPAGFVQPDCADCRMAFGAHLTGRVLRAIVTYVYSGDPRFNGLEPGHVVLGLRLLDGNGDPL